MGELQKALGDISSIKRQIADSTEFRGYGAATLASTSVMAVLAAFVQARLVHDAWAQLRVYMTIWAVTAVLAAAVTAVSMVTRTRRMHSGLSDEMLHMAVEQFLPALGAGLLLAYAMVRHAPYSMPMLPGLLQIVFSLGIFSSCRFLPRGMQVAAAWYLVTGLVCVGLGDARAFSPWAMGLPFCVGQMLVAAVLWMGSRNQEAEAPGMGE